jgi:hypothetical protein
MNEAELWLELAETIGEVTDVFDSPDNIRDIEVILGRLDRFDMLQWGGLESWRYNQLRSYALGRAQQLGGT